MEAQDLGTVVEQPHAATPSQPEDLAAEQQAVVKPGKPPSGSSGANSPRTVNSSADVKGLGPRHASSNNGKVSAAGSEAGLPPLGRQSSNLANRIAAYASGVAPVRRGITNADEDSITVEDVLHKLETAGRANGQDKCALPVPLIRSAHQHLVAAREEAARTAKELAELKASRVQHIPPSTWIKREQKYKMDQEKYEHIIGQLRQRSEALERELAVLREGSNVRPLEEKIQELEHQLVAAAAEKTKVQSKFHELSIKHRQLIETSPQVATIWNEVLVQQAADGHNAAAMQRLVNFDLRHTAASSGVSKAAEPVSSQPLPGVSAAAALYGNGSGPPPVPAAPQYSGIRGPGDSVVSTEQSGPSTPMQQPPAAGSPGPADAAARAAQQQPQSAEDRAHALMASVALEGLSPEASLAALQQLNYDLTMQLGCYQQMVSRLKDAMEQSDLEKAELEAEKMAMEMQMAGSSTDRSSSRGWTGWSWRRSIGLSAGGPHPVDDHDDAGSMADGASLVGMNSLSSSRRSSMDLDGGALATVHSSGSNTGTPTKAAAEAAAADGSSEDGKAAADGSGAQQQDQAKPAAASTSSGGGLFAARRQRAAVRAAAAAESLGKEVKELKRQVKSLQDENKYLVNNLVEIKMELAETQGNHDQAKRALVRAMDKESCMDMAVSELRHMLDMATTLNHQYEQQGATGHMAAAGAAAAGAMAAAAKAAVAAVSSTPNSAKAAVAAMQSPFGRAEPDQPAADAADSAVTNDDVAAVAGEGVVDAGAAAEAIVAAAEPEAAAGSLSGVGGVSVDAAGSVGKGTQPEQSQSEAVHSQPLQLSESSFEDADEGSSSGSTAAGSTSDLPAVAAGAAQVPAAEAAPAVAAAGGTGSAN